MYNLVIHHIKLIWGLTNGLKGALCGFGKEIQSQKYHFYNVNKVTIQTQKYLFDEYLPITEKTVLREKRSPEQSLKNERCFNMCDFRQRDVRGEKRRRH